MKKVAPLLVIVAIIGLAIAMVNKPNSSETTAKADPKAPSDKGETTTNDELIVVAPFEITSNDPAKSGSVFLNMGIAETLVDTDNSGALSAGLAKSWTANDSFTEWTFVLQDNIQFHDSTPLTADAVIGSLKVALTKPTALEQAKIKDISKVDDKTVKFSLEKPLNALPAYLAHYSTIILAPKAFDDKGEVVELIGTGAYQAVKIEPPQKLEQTAFDGYWGQKATIKKVTYLANSRSETRALLVQSKPNHLVYNLNASSMAQLTEDTNINAQSKSIARTIQFKVNGKHPFLGDKTVRQILSRAIDRQGIAIAVNKQEIGVAEELLPPIFGDWQIGAKSVKPDYPALKEELKSAGYGYDDQGNLLGKDGKAIKLTLKTFSDRPELPVIATAMQSQFKELGIDLEVAVNNSSDIPASHQNGTLELALYARNYGLVPNPSGILAEDFRPQGNDWGVMNWQNEELTKAFEALNKSTDESEQKALKQKISQIIHDERPIIPVLYYQQNVASHKTLKGVELDPFERSFGLNKLSW